MDPVLEAIKAMDEKFTSRFEAIEKFQDDSTPDDDDDEAKKKAKEEADAKEKEKNANKGKDGYDADGNRIPDDDKNKSRSQADKETFAALNNKVDTLSTSVKALTDENDTLRAERITDEIDSKVVYFKRVGIELGDDAKVEKFKKSLAKLDAQERQERYDEIEERYTRVPCGVRVDREGVVGEHASTSDDPVDVAAKATIMAQKYSALHGITMEEAHQIYSNQGEAGFEKFKRETAKA